MQWVSRSSCRPYQRAIGWLIGVIGPREIAAGVLPAHGNGKVATLTGGLAHDVSILLGAARHFGSQPRAKTSITIMRAPQCGHGQRSASGRDIRRLLRVGGRRSDAEECAGRRDALSAVGAGQEPVVANAMKPLGQHVQHEAPDELVRSRIVFQRAAPSAR